jgi:exopolysaccharide biosynthesis polyprenyl glycosylphosphotransferase
MLYNLRPKVRMSTDKDKERYRIKILMDVIEFITIIVSIPLAYQITSFFLGFFNYTWQPNIQQFTFFSIFILISWIVLYQAISLARLPAVQRHLTIFFHFVRVNFLNLVVLLILKFIFNLQSIPYIFIFFFVPVSMLITFAIRVLAFSKLNIYRTNGHNLRHVMVFADYCSENIIDRFIHQKEWGYKVDYIVTQTASIKEKYKKDIRILPDFIDLKKVLDNQVIDEVIYSKSQVDREELKKIVRLCNEVGVIFRLQSCSSPVDQVYLQMKTLNNQKQLALADLPSNNIPIVIKAMADIYFALTAVILLAPLFLFIAVLIKLESRGPVFFRQERLGLRGRKFKLYKFRTMAENAEQLLESLKKENEMDGPAFKMKEDPRITRVGKILRKTGIDEFPQLFNVIAGEMSLIGPRPPLEDEVRQYKRWQLRRLSVKPGITCTWQVIPNRNDVKFEKWMQLDLNYIDNWSLSKDLKLMFKTIGTMFMASGR